MSVVVIMDIMFAICRSASLYHRKQIPVVGSGQYWEVFMNSQRWEDVISEAALLQFMVMCSRSRQAHAALDSTSHLGLLVPSVPLRALIKLCSALVCGMFPPRWPS